MRILALDLATKSGASVDAADGTIVTAWCDFAAGLRKPGHGDLYAACQDFVTALIDEHQPEIVVCEEQIYRGKGSRLLGGYKSIVQLVCARRRVRFIDDLNAAKARELALGNGGLSKEAAAGLAILHFRLPKGLREDEIDARVLHEAARVFLKRQAIMSAARMPRVARKRRAPSATTAKSVSFLGR